MQSNIILDTWKTLVDPMGATFKELLNSLEKMEESISKVERDFW